MPFNSSENFINVLLLYEVEFLLQEMHQTALRRIIPGFKWFAWSLRPFQWFEYWKYLIIFNIFGIEGHMADWHGHWKNSARKFMPSQGDKTRKLLAIRQWFLTNHDIMFSYFGSTNYNKLCFYKVYHYYRLED